MHKYSFEYAEACGFLMAAQNSNYHIFFQSLFPTCLMPQTSYLYSLSHKNPEPLAFRKVDLRTVLIFPHLAALWINSLFGVNSMSQCFGLLCTGQNDPCLVILALYIVLVLVFARGGELRFFLLFDLDPCFYSHVCMLNNN